MLPISFFDLQKHRLKRAVQQRFDALGFEIRHVPSWSLGLYGNDGFMMFGIQIRTRPSILDLRKLQNEPYATLEELRNYLEAGHTLLANIATYKCRQLWGYIMHDSAPTTLAASELVKGRIEHAHAVLTEFFNTFQPRTAAEVVGLETERHPLMNHGPLGAPIPWGVLSPPAIEKVRLIDFSTDNLHNGKFNFSHRFGPADPDEVASEIQRLQRLIVSLQNKGYQRHDGKDGDVNGHLLVDDQSSQLTWSVLLTGGGIHRAAVLAAMGNTALPIRIKSSDFICRSMVAYWPQVLAGVYSVEEALSIFDRIIAATPPPACHWPPVYRNGGRK